MVLMSLPSVDGPFEQHNQFPMDLILEATDDEDAFLRADQDEPDNPQFQVVQCDAGEIYLHMDQEGRSWAEIDLVSFFFTPLEEAFWERMRQGWERRRDQSI